MPPIYVGLLIPVIFGKYDSFVFKHVKCEQCRYNVFTDRNLQKCWTNPKPEKRKNAHSTNFLFLSYSCYYTETNTQNGTRFPSVLQGNRHRGALMHFHVLFMHIIS
jgi:hypothetical protein